MYSHFQAPEENGGRLLFRAGLVISAGEKFIGLEIVSLGFLKYLSFKEHLFQHLFQEISCQLIS